jgi:tRNA(His) guanylyltransferase
MSDTRNDDLGDRMKSYEQPSTGRKAFKGQPIVARLDGKSFHTFTKGLGRPYDDRLSELMVATTMALVDRYQADVGYTQSDEITLIWSSNPEDKGELNFDGRFQKIESLSAAYATAFFNSKLPEYLPEKVGQLPIFDCRAYVVPNLQEAYHALLWRQQDATKNAISMAAQSFYKQSELNGKNSTELQEMIFQKGKNFNDYPFFFKRGTFVRRKKEIRELSEEQLANIPEQHREQAGRAVERSRIVSEDIWLKQQMDPVDFLFGSKISKPTTDTYKSIDFGIIKNNAPSHQYEYRIPSLNQNDPTSWNDYASAVTAAKDYIDWFFNLVETVHPPI